MARISFPTTRSIAPPLLVDEAQLLALDEIINRFEIGLREYRDREIEVALEREIQDRLRQRTLREEDVESQRPHMRDVIESILTNRDVMSVALHLKAGRAVRSERFSEALNQPIGAEEFCIGFRTYVFIGQVRAKVSVVDEGWRPELTIDVEPNDVEIAQEFFGALSNWAADIEAPKWQQMWVRNRDIFTILLTFWLMCGLMLLPVLNRTFASQRANRAEARRLLAQGITSSNPQKALDLLLAIESDYDAGGTRDSLFGVRYWTSFGIGAVILLIASFPPQNSIGVWKGKRKLKRWRAWTRALSVTIPLLVVASLILPWLLHLLGLSPPTR